MLGERCYKSLLDAPVEQAIEMRKRFGNPKVVWLQLGIRNAEAAARAMGEGLEVVEDRCMMVEHRKLVP